jgi:hypothetical protein
MSTVGQLVTDIKEALTIAGSRYDASIKRDMRTAITLNQGQTYWFLYRITSLALAQGDLSVALPADLAARDAASYADGGIQYRQGRGFDFLNFYDFEQKYYTQDPVPRDRPRAYTLNNGALHVSHTADKDYTIKLGYFRKDLVLPSNDDDTSVWLNEGFEYIKALTTVTFKQATSGFEVSESDIRAVQLAEAALNAQHKGIYL